MGKPFKVFLALAVIIATFGTIGYLSFYKPERTTIKTTAIKSPTQETAASTNQVTQTGEKEAIDKVRQLPEVKNFLARVANAYVEVSSFDEENGTYMVQVFEVKDNHTATFGWWEVEKISGKVKKSI